jgi:hypothetical protein
MSVWPCWMAFLSLAFSSCSSLLALAACRLSCLAVNYGEVVPTGSGPVSLRQSDAERGSRVRGWIVEWNRHLPFAARRHTYLEVEQGLFEP